jgi:ubiquinone/menaquinone biosynthesis C-methylase UbiE
MQQKDIFLHSEADAWFERNREACAKQDFKSNDPVTAAILDIGRSPQVAGNRLKILEVGCGEGRRLAWLAEHIDAEVHGVEPSAKAVSEACQRGVSALQGTADSLPYSDASFDIVVFGFCLYLCDQQDLFQIAQEANRVLKPDAWLVIHDFFAPTPMRRAYHHKPGVFSHKMDFRTLFDWHPAYTCYAHRLVHHGLSEFSDDQQEWVAISTLRKKTSSHD